METLFAGLTLAAITGLAWFAYYHPAQYMPVGQVLRVGSVVIYGLAATWSAGAQVAFQRLSPLFGGDVDKAKAVVDAMSIDALWATAATFAVLGYLHFLEKVVATLRDNET